MDKKRDIKRNRVMIYFIEAAENIIKEDGIAGVSIRRVAQDAGYNSATLYNYFYDLDHLVLFASIRYLRTYVADLATKVSHEMPAAQLYEKIYETFCYHCFRSPEIFHNLFFGKYSDRLTQVIEQYYELFPQELLGHDGAVKSMLMQGNIYARDEQIIPRLVEEGFISRGNAKIAINLIIRIHQSYLYDAMILGEDADPDKLCGDFMRDFKYILETAK